MQQGDKLAVEGMEACAGGTGKFPSGAVDAVPQGDVFHEISPHPKPGRNSTESGIIFLDFSQDEAFPRRMAPAVDMAKQPCGARPGRYSCPFDAKNAGNLVMQKPLANHSQAQVPPFCLLSLGHQSSISLSCAVAAHAVNFFVPGGGQMK